MERIRGSFEMKGDYRNEIEYQCDHHFFMLDDIGSTGKGSTDWRKEVIFEVVNLRYESQNPTVFSTNYNEKEIKESLGERTHSRLFAKENMIIDMFEYPDLRFY